MHRLVSVSKIDIRAKMCVESVLGKVFFMYFNSLSEPKDETLLICVASEKLFGPLLKR